MTKRFYSLFGLVASLVVTTQALARYAAVAEGITVQFYLAVLVARLVAMQISRSVD